MILFTIIVDAYDLSSISDPIRLRLSQDSLYDFVYVCKSRLSQDSLYDFVHVCSQIYLNQCQQYTILM